MSQKSTYRPDIDGLRALAVLAVILFHFKVTGFTGGFTGVDVFFVISGYLITGIIIKELSAGTFSLINFWERRIRRIVPALAVVLGCTASAAYFILLLPTDFTSFGKTLIAQSLFVSNWWFMGLSDYFSAPAETMPLLHTWSLAVEEQFYLLLPLFAVLIYTRAKKKFGLVIAGITLLSFAYSVWLVGTTPTTPFTIPLLPHIWGEATNSSAGFYFLLPRIWELLVGALLAIYACRIKNKRLAETTALLGLGAVGAGIFLLSDATPFPGLAALLPVLGTAAIIVANTEQQTVVKRFLSIPFIVGVGLISYSLYLWHWPLFVLAKQHMEYLGESMTAAHQILLIALTFILSWFTYRYVERPFRDKQYFTRPQIYTFGLISLLVLTGIGVAITHKQGFPERVSADARLLANAIEDSNPRTKECFEKSRFDDKNTADHCLLGVQDQADIDFILWGDSHANAVMTAFEEYGRTTNQTGMFFGVSGCIPLVSEPPINKDAVCREEIQRAVSYIQTNIPKAVFIVAEWREGYPFIDSEWGPFLSKLLSDTIQLLPSETQIIVVRRIPTYPNNSFRNLFFSLERESRTLHFATPRGDFDTTMKPFNAQINKAVQGYTNVQTLDPLDTMCDSEFCYIGDKEALYYYDVSHLSTYGAREIILPLLLRK